MRNFDEIKGNDVQTFKQDQNAKVLEREVFNMDGTRTRV